MQDDAKTGQAWIARQPAKAGDDEDFAGFRDGAPTGLLFEQAMLQTRMSICMTDPHRPDNPIVFANRSFIDLTGYSAPEIIGRNCRFLQGPGTDRATVAEVRDALASERVAVVEILNYRKDGSSFWNALHIGPIYGDRGELLYFFGSQWDVSNVRAARAAEHFQRLLSRELSHRIKNVFAVIGALVTLTGREEPDGETQNRLIRERVAALGRAHEATLAAADERRRADVEGVVRAVLAGYGADRLRSFDLGGPPAQVEPGSVSVISLALHELAVNATKHGALSDAGGAVKLRWRVESLNDEFGMLVFDWIEKGGPAVAPPRRESGRSLLDQLLRSARGSVTLDWRPEGLRAEVRLPIRRTV